ncbi:MAG: glutamyl-tRNA amidotransferase [Acidobacteria bacterium]|nr:glutamyl-tRNA amidotransferase [Acidobacteriota bacterium]
MRRRWLGACLVAASLGAAPLVADGSGEAQSTGVQAPADFDAQEKTIAELQAALTSGAVTSRGLVLAYLARIRAYDLDGPQLNAMLAMNPKVLETADALDRERAARGPRGPLHGIPIVIKDNFETIDMPTTGGTLALTGFLTGRDAFQVKRLRDAGAIIIGKTNLHELAAGITTISSAGGQTRNPYDLTRTPGGSSGGTGAAVAASFAAAGMGSDTCGSIRIPSANNNLFGLRGTMGLSSRDGIIPLSHSQDIGGPLARTVADLAVMLDVTVGADPADPVSAASGGHIPRSYRDALTPDGLRGVRIGVATALFGAAPEDEEVTAIDRRALDVMKNAGAEIVEVATPGLEVEMRGSSLIDAEFKFDLMDYLARWPNAPVHSLREILDRGDYADALAQIFTRRDARTARETPDVVQTRARRTAAIALVASAMETNRLDALAYPTLRRRAAPIGETQRGSENCQLSPATGLPAISVPAGFTDDGVPVGVELMGAAWSEARLLAMAFAYEQTAHPRRPPASTPSLVNGRAPTTLNFVVNLNGAHVTFSFNPPAGTLAWDATSTRPLAASVHRGRQGPVLATIMTNRASEAAGMVTLSLADRAALRDNGLFLSVRTMEAPQSVQRAALRVKAP